jgi:hypothetical protein
MFFGYMWVYFLLGIHLCVLFRFTFWYMGQDGCRLAFSSSVFSPHNLTSTECEETPVTEDMGISQRSISNGFIYVVDAHFIDKIERKQNNLDPSACGQILPQVCKIRVYILSTLEMFHESLYERQTLIFNTNYSFVPVTSKVSCIRRKRGQIICLQGNNKSMVILVLKSGTISCLM